MEYMSYDCFSLKKLNLGNKFDTQKVTNMKSLFQGCEELEELISGDNFDTQNVTNMEYMFSDLSILKELNLFILMKCLFFKRFKVR